MGAASVIWQVNLTIESSCEHELMCSAVSMESKEENAVLKSELRKSTIRIAELEMKLTVSVPTYFFGLGTNS